MSVKADAVEIPCGLSSEALEVAREAGVFDAISAYFVDDDYSHVGKSEMQDIVSVWSLDLDAALPDWDDMQRVCARDNALTWLLEPYGWGKALCLDEGGRAVLDAANVSY